MLLLVLGILVIAIGFAGLLLPGLPGTPLVLAGSVLVAWADGFHRVGWLALAAIAVLGLLGQVVESTASVLGARKAGASGWGMAGAFVGLLVGLPFGLAGIILGPVAGATLLEYLRNPQVKGAARAGVGVFLGFVVGTAVKSACAFAMVGILLLSYLF